MRRPLTEAEARARLRAACLAVGGQKRWSTMNQISQSHVSKVLAGEKRLTARTMSPLGLARVEAWVQLEQH